MQNEPEEVGIKVFWSHPLLCVIYADSAFKHGLRTPREFFFRKFWTFGLGQTNWAEILWGILGISGQTISTILAQWVPCPWERVAGSLSYKKLWFLGLKHTTPKSSQNKILAVKNLWNSVRTSVFGALHHRFLKLYKCFFSSKNFGADKEQPTVTLTIRF